MCCIFHLFKRAEAQESCLPVSHAPLAPTETHVPPLPAISLVGRRAKPKQCGMSGPVPAGSCRAHPGGAAMPPFTATAQRCGAAPAWAGTQSTHVLSVELHTSHWLSGIFFFFFSTLAKGNEEWTDLKDMIVLGVYSKIISLSMQWNLNNSTIFSSQPVSTISPRSIQTGWEWVLTKPCIILLVYVLVLHM